MFNSMLHALQLRVWDLSGQTMLLLLNDKNKILKDSQKQIEQDVSIDLIFCKSSNNLLLNCFCIFTVAFELRNCIF